MLSHARKNLPQSTPMNQTFRSPMGASLSSTRLATLIFGLSFLLYIFSPQGIPSNRRLIQGGEVPRTAISVAQRGTFADPFAALPTGSTAHVAPGYVLIYAAIAKLFGAEKTGANVLWLLNIGFLALQFALLPILSERLGLGVLPGALAAAFGAVIQPYHVLPEWESLFTGALMVVLCVVTLPYFKSPRDWQHSALLGFLWGIAILTNPQCVLLLFAWPHIAAIENPRAQLSRARRAMLVVLAGAAVACLPWFIRNYQRFHAVFFVRDNFGLELSTSNNPCARPTLLENINSGCHNKTHPNPSPELAGEVFDKGEIRFNQEQLDQALTWISSNPRAFASLTGWRFLKFWFPYLGSLRYAIPTGLLTIFSFAGLAVMFRKHRLAAWMLASTLLLYPFVHYFVQFEARYRYPVFWATFLPAAYALVEFAKGLRRAPALSVSAAQKQDELVSLLK
jgi:hypothetical protein